MTTQTLSAVQSHSFSEDFIFLRLWDFVIIGAGPAGTMAAYELAKAGATVLLLDQSSFPRDKVCGGCFSAQAVKELEDAGLGSLLKNLKPINFDSLLMTSRGKSARIRIPQGVSLSRKDFDFALMQEACQAGAVFLPSTKGFITHTHDQESIGVQIVQATVQEKKQEVRARFVLAADGLSGLSLKNYPENKRRTTPDSLVGVAALLKVNHLNLEENSISMVCHPAGYVGMVSCGKDQLHIAAALRPEYLKSCGSPSRCIETILQENGLAAPQGIQHAVWQGVSRISQTRTDVSGHRYFVLGDASFFVEPFTGEGIYWAILQARALANFLCSKHFIWNENLIEEWKRKHHSLMKRKRVICRIVAVLLRSPVFCQGTIFMARHFPWLIHPLIREIHGRINDEK